LEFGLGRIFASGQEVPSLRRGDESLAWQAALGIQPYESTRCLHSSAVFSRQGPIEGLPLRMAWSWWLFAALVLWLCGLITLAILKRGKYAPLLAYSALCFVLAIAGGFALDRSWQRGCLLVSRAVILPADGGVLLDASANMSNAMDNENKDTTVVPWDVSIDFDRVESGNLHSAAPFNWRHGAWKPYFTVRSSGGGAVSLGASLPASILDGTSVGEALRDFSLDAGKPHLSGVNPQWRLAYLPAHASRWWDYSAAAGAWVQGEQIPDWLKDEGDWILRARECLGQRGILVGFNVVPELGLSVQGKAAPGLFWLLPVAAEGGR
jgi:hypothetical protein